VGRLGLGVGVKTSIVMLHGGEIGSFRVRVGVKTSLVTDTENGYDGTVALSATVPSRRYRYRQDGTRACAGPNRPI